MTVGIEDLRPAVRQNGLPVAARDANGEMDPTLDDIVHHLNKKDDQSNPEHEKYRAPAQDRREDLDHELDGLGPHLPSEGETIEVYWPMHNQFYPETVHNNDTKKRRYDIHCTDGDRE